MTFGSLFAGIGGFDLGLERAGMECRWQVEIDPFCRKVLAKHWPDVPRYEDVRDVGAHNLEPVDLICGGFPCQDISSAGRRAGIRGERSGLWSEMCRVVCELRPAYVLVENVSDLLHRGLGVVLGELAEIGYDAEWDCIPASAVRAPHQRDRVFVLAYSNRVGRGEESRLPEVGGSLVPNHRRRSADVPHPDSIDAPPQPRVFKGLEAGPARDERQWLPEPDVDRVVDGFSFGVDRRRALGNAVVPQVAEWIGRRLMEAA